MMVSHQEASGIAAKDASSKHWMTKTSPFSCSGGSKSYANDG